eukprot:COSAG05_NODE_1698_length_4256_cov_26.898737_2_plen_226_part_00
MTQPTMSATSDDHAAASLAQAQPDESHEVVESCTGPHAITINDCCAICLDQLPPYTSESLARVSQYTMALRLEGTVQLPCHHRFHKRCAASWFHTGGQACPLCRAPTLHDMLGTTLAPPRTYHQPRPYPPLRMHPSTARVAVRTVAARFAASFLDAEAGAGAIYDVHSIGRLDGPILLHNAGGRRRRPRQYGRAEPDLWPLFVVIGACAIIMCLLLSVNTHPSGI